MRVQSINICPSLFFLPSTGVVMLSLNFVGLILSLYITVRNGD